MYRCEVYNIPCNCVARKSEFKLKVIISEKEIHEKNIDEIMKNSSHLIGAF